EGGCADQGCITCTILEGNTSPSYSTKYLANVSIPLSQYRSASSLDYTFSYHFKWASDQVPAGYPLSAQLAVGSSSNTDSFVSSDAAQLWIDNPILGDPFTHSGTTSVLRSADGSTGYIPIILDFSFPRPPPSRCYWFLVTRSFRITTPTSNGGSSPSPSSALPGLAPPSSVAVMVSSTSISVGSTTVSGSVMPVSVAVPIVQTLMTLVLPAPGTSNNNNGGNVASDGSSGRGSVQTSAIVGGVVGAIAFLGLVLALAIFLLRKQRRRSLEQQGEKEMIQGGGGGLDGRRRKDSMHQGGLAGETTGTPVAFSRPTSFASSPSSSEPGRRVSVATSILPTTAFRPISSSRVVEPASENGAAPDRRSAATGGGGGRGQRRRGHQTLFLAGPTPMTATYSDVPPPAYSDVNGTTRIAYYNVEEEEGDETEEEDEGETSMSRSPVTNPSSPIVHGQSTESESVYAQRAQETRVPLGEKSGT
ncbi:hypothetical protein FRC17_004770, partial [Serendipita sp. 399]